MCACDCIYVCVAPGADCSNLVKGDSLRDPQEQFEATCTNLFTCFITIFKEGVRSGGGIGDVLRKPAGDVSFVGLRPIHASSVSDLRPCTCICDSNFCRNGGEMDVF